MNTPPPPGYDEALHRTCANVARAVDAHVVMIIVLRGEGETDVGCFSKRRVEPSLPSALRRLAEKVEARQSAQGGGEPG